MSRSPDEAAYSCEGRKFSMNDLLAILIRDEYMKNGVPRAADLHFRIGRPIRMRLDDNLVEIDRAEPLTREAFERLVHPLLNDEQIAKLERVPPVDIDASYEMASRAVSFRLNVFVDRNGPACVIRVLPRQVPSPEELGFPDDRVWREIVQSHQGLAIVTGVTGSGKSTTIASLLQYINRTRAVRIITLEDPIEYVIEDDRSMVSQRQVGVHVSSFTAGLRSALREDPDVIFVGEMRDRETAGLALTAAETGHLVLSTLHTRGARGALSRIVDLFPPERSKELCSQLSFSLAWVIAQNLLNRKDGTGRVPAMEILRNNRAVANLVRMGSWHQLDSMMETHAKEGMITLDRHLADLVRAEVVTPEEASRHAEDASFAARLK